VDPDNVCARAHRFETRDDRRDVEGLAIHRLALGRHEPAEESLAAWTDHHRAADGAAEVTGVTK
jgi:hypothetical protein